MAVENFTTQKALTLPRSRSPDFKWDTADPNELTLLKDCVLIISMLLLLCFSPYCQAFDICIAILVLTLTIALQLWLLYSPWYACLFIAELCLSLILTLDCVLELCVFRTPNKLSCTYIQPTYYIRYTPQVPPLAVLTNQLHFHLDLTRRKYLWFNTRITIFYAANFKEKVPWILLIQKKTTYWFGCGRFCASGTITMYRWKEIAVDTSNGICGTAGHR